MQIETNNQHPYRHNNKTIREEYRIEFNWPFDPISNENPFFSSISIMCYSITLIFAFVHVISDSKDKTFDSIILVMSVVGLLSSMFRYIRLKKVQI